MNSQIPEMFKLNPLDVKQTTKLSLPAYVPPKPIHRPVYEVAEGIVVREHLTGRVLS